MLVERIFQHAHSQPHHPALVWNDQVISYQRYAHAIATLREEWQLLAPPPGNVVVVVVHSLLESWAAVLALQSLGLVTACTRSLKEAMQLGLDRSPAVVVCARKSAENLAQLATWPQACELPLPTDLFSRPPAAAASLPVSVSCEGGHILYTSGTTGTYKKLLQDNARDDQRYTRRVATEGLSTCTIWNNTYFGLWTSIGYGRPLSVWHAGGTVVFDQRANWALHLGDHGVTHLTLVPSALAHALRALPAGGTGTPRWSFELSVGGGFLSRNLARQALDRLTPLLAVNYACTELGQLLRGVVDDLDNLHWLRPVGTRETQVVTEDGSPCPQGVEGMLRARPAELDFNGYLDDPDSTARVFRDGWFYPGDLAVRRADGRIRILGRTGDVINLGGTKLASAPIEETLCDALGVEAVCAFSVPDADGEGQIILAVETTQPIPAQALQDAARKVYGLQKVRFMLLRRFPRSSTGMLKIDRMALRRQIGTLLDGCTPGARA